MILQHARRSIRWPTHRYSPHKYAGVQTTAAPCRNTGQLRCQSIRGDPRREWYSIPMQRIAEEIPPHTLIRFVTFEPTHMRSTKKKKCC